MSEIRPFLPAPLNGPAQTAPTPASRQAQAAFFRAALAGAEAANPAPRAPAVIQTPVSTQAPASTQGEAQVADRPLRPGSYLDIRV